MGRFFLSSYITHSSPRSKAGLLDVLVTFELWNEVNDTVDSRSLQLLVVVTSYYYYRGGPNF